jgi:hypothetical protein
MIIEGAFFKLPELLLGHDSPEGQYEATLASHLAMAVLLELNARNIPMPQRRIHVERPYPVEKTGPAARSDLHVDLDGVFPPGPSLSHYGFHAHNWIECKFYAKIGRARGTTTKISDVGRLTRDLLRLCLFVKEKVSDVQANGRYLVAVFNRRPSEYLAFHRQSPDPDRTWLQELLIPGRHQIEIPLRGETKSLLNKIGQGFVDLDEAFDWFLNMDTQTFEPGPSSDLPNEILYWGYLVRIIGFSMRFGSEQVICRDNVPWSDEQVVRQQRLADHVLDLMGDGE